MKQKLLLSVGLFVFIMSASFGQCPSGDLIFTTQAEIDDFGINYNQCTQITVANLIIGIESGNTDSDITDLTPLQNITEVTRNLVIRRTDLTQVDGLDSFTSIGGFLQIQGNSQLENLVGLSAVNSIGESLTVQNNALLTNLNGLSSITTVGGYLNIQNNPLLTNLNSLSSIESINGYLKIQSNHSLTNILGLININPATITGNGLQIINNFILETCNLPFFCEYLSGAGNRTITGNLGDCLDETAIANACALGYSSEIAPNTNNILFVNKNVSGGNGTGNSWANALPELADALKYAKLNQADWSANIDLLQIYVAAGTYKPLYSPADSNFGNDAGRANSFLMVKNVQLYGGFDPANGITDLNHERILPIPESGAGTILSGDVNDNDVVAGSGSTLNITNNGENNLHVMINTGDVGSVLLDGFTITGANANNTSSIAVNGKVVQGYYGGGIYNYQSTALPLTNVVLYGNTAINGAAIYNFESPSTLTEGSIIKNFGSSICGGIYNDNSSPILKNVVIRGNKAGGEAGAIYNSFVSSPILTNVLIAGNAASQGGGIYNITGNGIFTNTTIAGNTPNELYAYGWTFWNNTIVWGNILGSNFTTTNSLVKGRDNTNSGNIDAIGYEATDIFTDPANGDYTLLVTAPVVNAGNNQLYLDRGGNLQGDLDLAGNPRLYASNIDIGAYEFLGDFDCPDLLADTGDACQDTEGNDGIVDEDCNCFVAPPPVCPKITGLVITPGVDYADITWNGNAPEYELLWSYVGEFATMVTLTETHYRISDLPPSTPFPVSIRAKCAPGFFSEWVNSSFHTLPSPFDCPNLGANIGDTCQDTNGNTGIVNADCECFVVCEVPTDLMVDAEVNSAEITWNSDDSDFELLWGEIDTAGTTVSVTGTSYYLDSLDPETDYFVSVRTVCNASNNFYSDWVDTSFYTLPLPFDCPNLGANIGDACQDTNGNTGVVNADCECFVECVVPTDLMVDAEVNSADISWNSDDSDFELLWGEINTAGTTVSVTGTSYYLDSLDPETDYFVSVRTVCNASNNFYSDWVDTNFSTDPITYDCPSLQANFGDDCRADSGYNGVIDEDCDCTEGCLWTVTLQSNYWGDEVNWYLATLDGEMLLTGGPYEFTYDDVQSIIAEGPLKFMISNDGTFGDNTPSYTVSNGVEVVLSGTLTVRGTITYFGLECEPRPIDFTYEDGVWFPENPTGIADSTSNIIVINGAAIGDDVIGDTDANNLTVMASSSLEVAGVLNIYGDLSIYGDLVFLSDANGDGQLGVMAGSLTGEATVHRYFKDRRSYRMVSSAVTTSTSIHDNWQEGAVSNDDDPNPGFGTHITGALVDQENGFDATQTGNSSMYIADVPNQQFVAISNTDVDVLEAGAPYLLFVRGDRGIDLTENSAFSETVLRAKGQLFTGSNTQNFPTVNAGQFAMFGNPYQSTVNINDVFSHSDNVNTGFYYIYDPSVGDYGGFVTVVLPQGTNTFTSESNEFLQPGQAAQFATLTNGASAINFIESDKSPGNFTSTNFNDSRLSSDHMLTIQLYTTENYFEGGLAHDALGIQFDSNFDNAITPSDAVKPMNIYENLAVQHSDVYLSIERREMPVMDEVYQLYTNGYTHTNYTLRLLLEGLEDVTLYLEDNYIGTSTALDGVEVAYPFSVDANDPMSIATNRFSIRVGERSLGVNNNNLLTGISLFPNPINSDIFYINAPRLDGKNVNVSISDVLGRQVYTSDLDCVANKISVSLDTEFASGVYLVTLRYAGEESTLRLIRE